MRRREFFALAAAGAAAINSPANSNEIDDACEYYAALLAQALAQKHGSQWKIKVDSGNQFVLILRA